MVAEDMITEADDTIDSRDTKIYADDVWRSYLFSAKRIGTDG